MKIAVFSDNKEVNHLFLSDLEQGNLLYLDFQKDNNSSKIYLKKSFWSSEVSINESLSKNQITTLISFKSSFPKLKKEDAAIQKVLYFLDVSFLQFPQYFSFFEKRRLKKQYQKSISEATEIITISQFAKEIIVQFFNVNTSKIRVEIPVSVSEKFSENYQQEIREKFQLPERFIVHQSQLTQKDNTFGLVKAIQNTEIPLVIVGLKTKELKKSIQFSKKNKFDKRLIHLSNLTSKEISVLNILSDFLVYPTLYDNVGLSVLRSKMAQIPSVLGNNSGLQELGGNSPLYVDSKNIDDVKSKILFLWNNAAERERRKEMDCSNPK